MECNEIEQTKSGHNRYRNKIGLKEIEKNKVESKCRYKTKVFVSMLK